MHLKITFVANYLPDKQESMLRLSELLRGVIEEAGLETETIRPVDRVGKLRCVFPQWEKWLGYADKFLIFPLELFLHALGGRRDMRVVYHIIDHSNAVYSFVLGSRPHVTTCNDVVAIRSALGEIPEHPIGLTGRFLQNATLAGLRHSPRVVCISDNTAHELRRLISGGSDRKQKITSALLPLNFDFKPMAREEALAALNRLGPQVQDAIRAGFIFHVGSNLWYKNRRGVCEIYFELARQRIQCGQLPITLILAGPKPSPELAKLVRMHDEFVILFVTRPTNEEVRALYSLATVLLFPSLEEGFGWPIAEAMACGCPVVTTGRAPMTEVGSEAAVYIDPSDTAGSARLVNDVLEWGEARRAACIKRGFANLKRFDRSSLAAHYIAAYEDVVSERQTGQL